jgi:hypothetical protein
MNRKFPLPQRGTKEWHCLVAFVTSRLCEDCEDVLYPVVEDYLRRLRREGRFILRRTREKGKEDFEDEYFEELPDSSDFIWEVVDFLIATPLNSYGNTDLLRDLLDSLET